MLSVLFAVCRKTCLECGKALENARAMLANLKPKLPARKLPAAPPSLPSTPTIYTTTMPGNTFLGDDNRVNSGISVSDMITGVRNSIPLESRAAMRAAGCAGISPTSTVWGDDVAEESMDLVPVAMGERHFGA